MNTPIAATAGRSRLNAANGQGRGIAAQKNKRSKREISGRAWVVEIPRCWIEGGDDQQWAAWKMRSTRSAARSEAREMRRCGCPARVRQYIRQQETRP